METKSMREAFGNALVELGRQNSDIVVVDADLAASTKTDIFKMSFPESFIDVGIAEQNLIGVSAGLASTGKNVFASSFAVFETGRAYEVIRNMVCMANLNVKLCATHAGLMTGPDGATHQAIEDIAIMRVLPNMKVVVPADSIEVSAMIKKMSEIEGPVYVRIARDDVENLLPEEYKFELGKSVLMKDGSDISIIACGPVLKTAIDAAYELEEEGINARVINMSSIKPIDEKTLLDCSETTFGIVTVEDHSIIGGLGSAVSEYLSETKPTYIEKIGVNDKFGMSGKTSELYDEYGITVENIKSKARTILKKNQKNNND